MSGLVRAFSASARRRYALRAFVGQTVFAGVSFAGSIITARLFGPEGRGELTAWFLAANVASLVLAGPLPVGMGRALLTGVGGRLVVASWVHAAAAAAVGSVAAVVAALVGLDPVAAVLFLVVTTAMGVVLADLLVVFQAAKLPWAYHAARIPAPAALTIGLVLLWAGRGGVSLTDAYVLLALGTTSSAVAASLLVRARVPQIASSGVAPHKLKAQLLAFARLGRGSYWAVLLDTLLLRADQFVILLLGNAEDLGLYVVAVNCSEIGLYLGHAIGQSAFEDEATLDRAQARRLIGRSAAIMAGFALVLAVVGWFLIPLVFGDAFRPSRYALVLLAPGIIARTAAYTGSQIMLAQGRGARVSRVTAVTTAAAVVLAAIGAWQWGIYGVATASTLAYILQMILVEACFRPRARLTPT